MLRIEREKLDKTIDAFMSCAISAKTIGGRRIVFPLTRHQAEASVLAALSAVAPLGGPATASDVYFVEDFGDGNVKEFPPRIPAAS